MASSISLINLPEHILNQIMSYLTYSEISEYRRVCQTFNRRCSSILNNSFARVDRFHLQIHRNVKQQLPRRESERRSHPLSRHADVLSAVETRLSLLSMTYSKYIELNLCCFIPGKVLDELYRILNLLQQTDRQLPRSHEFLQELRDISSMAMEHFEENVVPVLKNHISPSTMSITGNILSDVTSCPSASASWTASVPRSLAPGRLPALRQDPLRLQQQIKAQNTTMLALRKEQHEQRSKLNEQRRLITEQERKLQEQSKLIMELTTHAQAQEIKVEKLSRQVSLLTGQSFSLVDSHNLMHQPPSDPLIGGDNSVGKGAKLENANSWGTVLGGTNKDKLSKDYYVTCAEATKSSADAINEHTCNDSYKTNVMNTLKNIPSKAACHSEQGKSSEDINIAAADLSETRDKKAEEEVFSDKRHESGKNSLKRKSGSLTSSDDVGSSVSSGNKHCRR